MKTRCTTYLMRHSLTHITNAILVTDDFVLPDQPHTGPLSMGPTHHFNPPQVYSPILSGPLSHTSSASQSGQPPIGPILYRSQCFMVF